MSGTQAKRFAIVSSEIFTLRLENGRSLEPVDIAVFAALATYASSSERYCFPSIGKLGSLVKRGRRTIMRSLARLEESGAITSSPRYDENRRQTSNGYVLELLKAAPKGDAQHPLGGIRHDTPEGDIYGAQTRPRKTDSDEQKLLEGPSVPPTNGQRTSSSETGEIVKRRMTFRQANATGELRDRCIAYAMRRFSDHGWPKIRFDLIWDEFSQFWGVEAARKTKLDWPSVFFHRAMERRTFGAYQSGGTHGRKSEIGHLNLIDAAGDLIAKYANEDAGEYRVPATDRGGSGRK